MTGRLAIVIAAGVMFGPLSADAVAQSPESPSVEHPEAVPVESGRGVSTEGDPSPFDELVRGLLADLRRVPSSSTISVLTTGAFGANMAHAWDDPVSSSMSRSASLENALGAGATLGSARVQMAGAAATYALGLITKHRGTRAIGADLIQGHAVTQAITAAVKVSVHRTRPDRERYSFPSGHTSASFATATVLQHHLGWRAGVPAYAVATYVAASRVQTKRHYLSDVAFGAALGIATGRSVTVHTNGVQLTLIPTPVPGGGAVTVVLE